jgi:hypothetical protein
MKVALALGCTASALAGAVAGLHLSPSPEPDPIPPLAIDYELTADCLAEHQALNNFNETLAQAEHHLRFCIEVWPSAAQP